MKNIYSGCFSNDEIIYSKAKEPFDITLEKTYQKYKSLGYKIVFYDINNSFQHAARVVLYKNKIPEIMQNCKDRYVKINGKWIRNNLLGYCDQCGEYKELICISSKYGHICKECDDKHPLW